MPMPSHVPTDCNPIHWFPGLPDFLASLTLPHCCNLLDKSPYLWQTPDTATGCDLMTCSGTVGPCHPQGGHCPACFAENLTSQITSSYGKRLPTSAAPILVQSLKLSNKKGKKKRRKKYVSCHPPAEVLAQYLGNSEQMRPYKLSNLTDQPHHFHRSQYQPPQKRGCEHQVQVLCRKGHKADSTRKGYITIHV